MNESQQKFTAVVLAADRGADDPVARAAGARCKSMASINGTPMVFRVLDALAAATEIDARILSGPPQSIVDLEPDLKARISSGEVKWIESQQSPSTSAYHVLQSLPEQTPVLLTTADHAMLSARVVDYFCTSARKTGCDVVAGLARHEMVTKAYPQTRRTATRLQDGSYCGCNLFAFLTPRARRAADFWRQVENQRKNPLRVIRVLGVMAVLRYLLGNLSLAGALDRLSQRLGFSAGAVDMPFAEAAIDVDSVEDLKLVGEILAKRQE
ncbi:MAG: nucleotidyltransferase family protein [Desulfobacteraceae bacterium]|jgi:GTP:adenosylcobinamide-phosphate guanylyltransferase|nr:nucleotidyltransferase family protein [Desulfobacteraceae bacterium]